jgi:hypothetical protein
MPERERRQAQTSHSQSSSQRSTTSVRRNLFHQHLSRRPTTSSTSTSAETLRLDIEPESDTSEIVVRDKNGDFEIGDPPVMQNFDDQEEAGDAHEDESTLAYSLVAWPADLILWQRNGRGWLML